MVKSLRVGIVMKDDDLWMGGVVYIQNLVKALAILAFEKQANIKLILLVNSEIPPILYEDIRYLVSEIYRFDCLRNHFFNKFCWKMGERLSWFQDRRFVDFVKTKNIDFLYPIPMNLGISWDFHCRYSAWLPDFQHKYLPNFFTERSWYQRETICQYVAQKAINVVLSSKAAMEDFEKFYPHSKSKRFLLRFRTIPESKWFQNKPAFLEIQSKYKLPDRFFLVSNQFWIHKNHKIVIQALEILKQKNINPVVVCTGKLFDYRFPHYGEEIQKLIKEKGLRDQFITLGLIPRCEQIQLMRRAIAVIQPSLFEGWSTVVEDARLLGKAIILSDIPVHLEQNPPNAQFFKRDSPEELAENMELAFNRLGPGPDAIAELAARQKNRLESQDYEKQFFDVICSLL
jgi:glycosyltransferase involved in cell wall biosynthesis